MDKDELEKLSKEHKYAGEETGRSWRMHYTRMHGTTYIPADVFYSPPTILRQHLVMAYDLALSS